MTQMLDEQTPPEAGSVLPDLLSRRATLQRWLDGLDAQRGLASEKVLDRVRADYESRLAEIDASLTAHVAGIREELSRAEDRAAAAEREHDDALDALEEARLRHTIGEIPDEGWEESEARLTDVVANARSAEEGARSEAERLRELLAGIGRETTAGHGKDWLDPHVDPEPTIESSAATATDPRREAGGGSDAVDEGASGEGGTHHDPDGPPGPETTPQPGLKCVECGYTNDISAWFCGVCGADVG